MGRSVVKPRLVAKIKSETVTAFLGPYTNIPNPPPSTRRGGRTHRIGGDASGIAPTRSSGPRNARRLALRKGDCEQDAMLFAHAGRAEETLDWLETAYADGAPRLHLLSVDPDWRFLRDEPRFQALLRLLDL